MDLFIKATWFMVNKKEPLMGSASSSEDGAIRHSNTTSIIAQERSAYKWIKSLKFLRRSRL